MVTRQPIINVPDDFLEGKHLDEAAFARELSLLAAVKLHELGRLTSGGAAELAGMSRVEFLSALKKFQVFPLEAELEDFEHGCG